MKGYVCLKAEYRIPCLGKTPPAMINTGQVENVSRPLVVLRRPKFRLFPCCYCDLMVKMTTMMMCA